MQICFFDEHNKIKETQSSTHKHVFEGPFGQPAVEEDGNEQVTQRQVEHLSTNGNQSTT